MQTATGMAAMTRMAAPQIIATVNPWTVAAVAPAAACARR
jgi:hypothetical protein